MEENVEEGFKGKRDSWISESERWTFKKDIHGINYFMFETNHLSSIDLKLSVL